MTDVMYPKIPQKSKAGFATIEPFIVSFILVIVGVVISLSLRWMLSTVNLACWIPAIIFSIPAVFFLGFVPFMILKEKLGRGNKK